MAPLKQGSMVVSGVKEEWGGAIWHLHMDYLPREMVVPPL